MDFIPMTMGFIPMKNARIGWELDRNTHKVTNFCVISIIPGEHEHEYFRRLTFTIGNCNSCWSSLDPNHAILEILRIFFEYDFPDKDFVVSCLLECGRIKELEALRKMINVMYFPRMTFKEFEEEYYY